MDIVNGPVAVGSDPPNAYGLHGVAGNVSEWVDASAIQGRQRVYGGSWLSGSSWFCRVYIRELRPPKTSNGHGFRCATDAN
jgi:formylglycine-generating enzyme required for sulfatase activity